jgi:hypothetical protein
MDDWFCSEEKRFHLDGASFPRILECGRQIMLMILMRHLRTAAIYKSGVPFRENDYIIFFNVTRVQNVRKIITGGTL